MKKPNILLFICDHLSPRVIGAYGEDYSWTPAISRIAEQGTRFTNAYTNCPLCMPSRASFWTSRYPHETNVLSNGREFENGPLPEDIVTVGDMFSANGYDTVHFGKQHDFGTLRGFDCAPVEKGESAEPPHPAWPENEDTLHDNASTEKCVDWLEQPHERPFLAVADLNNPHNICGWVGENNSLEGPVRNIAPPCDLPALPDNFHVEDMANRPRPIQFICCSHNRMAQASHWTEENYRHYVAAYCHYSELADRKIGMIMDALEKSGNLDNTMVIVTADHADGMASHGMVTKQVSMYDETMRVPFILSGSGIPRDGAVRDGLIQLLDLAPTLADIAGLEKPRSWRGTSVLPLVDAKADTLHEYVAGEWHTEWGFTISPGRMIRTGRYKYIRYLEGNGEELYAMQVDPGETRNLAGDPDCETVLQEHRDLLERHLEGSADRFQTYPVNVDPKWRSHPVGYANHNGLPAPMAEG